MISGLRLQRSEKAEAYLKKRKRISLINQETALLNENLT